MLTPIEIEELRAQQAQALPDLCSISRPTRVVDNTGGYSDTFATVASNVACRVSRQTPREVQQAGKTVVLADWVVTLPYGTDARADDVITTGAQTLHIVGLLSGGWRTAERALCTG